MYKAVIIDDEIDSRETIQNYVSELFADIAIIGQAENVSNGIQLIKSINPDLIFLDINMPDGTGFDLVEKLKDRKLNIIFVTAYDNYAIKAFKFSAIDYVLKPIDPDSLQMAVRKFRSRKEADTIQQRLMTLIGNQNSFEKIALPTLEGFRFIDVVDIIYCESEGSYTWFHTISCESFLVSKQLKDFEKILDSCGFYRVHQSQLINLKYLKEYKKGDGGTAILTNNIEVDVARRRKEGFLKALMKYSA